MRKLHTIEAEHIVRLQPGQLVSLLRTLLNCEARPGGQAVHVPQQINVPDGGEDGRWDGEVKANEFIPASFTIYQSKAESLDPADCAAAMYGTDGGLKPAVADVVRRGGSYVFFCGRPYVYRPHGIEDRIAAAIRAITEAGVDLRGTSPIRFLDANKIASWTNRHAAAVAHVAMCCQLGPVGELRTWADWQRDTVCGSAFYSNTHLDRAMASLRKHFTRPGRIARITGYSGLGKTRLAFEALRPPPAESADIAQSSLSHSAGYLDMEHSPENVMAIVSAIEASGMSGVLVIDNCPKAQHRVLTDIVSRHGSRLCLLTLDYEPEYPVSGVLHVPLEPEMMADVVPKMLRDLPHARRLSEAQVNHIAAFASGFPQIAALMAEAGDTLDFAKLDQKGLVQRILWGRGSADKNAFSAISALSLFAHVGFDGDLNVQKTFVREHLCGHPPPSEREFDSLLRPFFERRLVQKASAYRFVAPPPLAVALAAYWWDLATTDELKRLLPLIATADLTEAFCRRVKQLHFSPTAVALADQLLEASGPLSDAGVLSSEPGSQVFRAFVELNPACACECLWRIFGGKSIEELRSVKDGRRNLIWSLEKICWRQSEFPGGAELLLRFAAAENEPFTNNATGQFKQLFQVFLSGTQMPAHERLSIIEEGLGSSDSAVRRICVEALGVGLMSRHFSRSGGVEIRGSGLPEEDWTPKYESEIADYWLRCFDLLVDVVMEGSAETELAKAELGRRLRGILLPHLVERFEPSFKRAAEALGGFWPEALGSLRSLFEFDRNNLPPPIVTRLEEWVTWITPKDLAKRITLTVTAAPYECSKSADGRIVDLAEARAEELADELAPRLSDLLPHLDSLQTGEQRQAYRFGRRLVQHVADPTPLVEECLASLARVPADKRNARLLGGVLAGVANRTFVHGILERVAASPELIDQLVPLTQMLPIDADAFQRAVDLVSAGKLAPEQLRHFAYGSVLDKLAPEAVLTPLRRLVNAQPRARTPVFDVVCMYVYRSEERWVACRDFLRALILLPKFSLDLKGVMDLHHWEQTAEKMLKEGRDDQLAHELTAQIIEAQHIEEFRFDGNSVRRSLLGIILSTYPEICWPQLAVAILSRDHYRLEGLLGKFGFDDRDSSILWNVPRDILVAWALANPAGKSRLLAIMALFYVDKEEVYHWHPSVLALLESGVDEQSKKSIARNLYSYGSTGSRVPYIERRIRLLSTLYDHPDASVRKMAQEISAAFEADKSREEISDEQEAAGIY